MRAPVAEVSPDAMWGAVQEHLRSAIAGEFEIIRELGRGGMAAVFLAEELALSRRVAIKVMAPTLLLDPGMVARFRHEAIAVARLNHPRIITIHAVRQVGDLHFFVMNYVEGRSLEAVLRDMQALSVPLAHAILKQVGDALDYAHGRGVIHRDIKPANLLLDLQGNVIITDFGIAKVVESPGHTQAGLVIGTLSYMSPEQLGGTHGITGASDQYSLAVVIYEALMGHPPFRGTAAALMQGHLRELPRPIREVRPDCPPDFEAVLNRMLEKGPDARWPSLAAALDRLSSLPTPAPQFTRSQLGALAAAGAPSGEPGGTSRPTATIESAPAPLHPGATATLAPLRGIPGLSGPPGHIRWQSDNLGVASVDENGLVRARGEGIATVSAFTGGTHSVIQVRVVREEPTSRAATTTSNLAPGRGVRADRERQWRVVAPLVSAACIATLVGAVWIWTRQPQATAPSTANVIVHTARTDLSKQADLSSAFVTPAARASDDQTRHLPSSAPKTVDRPKDGPTPPARNASAPEPAPRPTEEEIVGVINRFVSSIAKGNAEATRVLYPELRGDEAWWQFATDPQNRPVQISYFAMHPSYPQIIDGSSAQVRFDLTFSYQGDQIKPWLLTASVVQVRGAWVIRDVRYHQ